MNDFDPFTKVVAVIFLLTSGLVYWGYGQFPSLFHIKILQDFQNSNAYALFGGIFIIAWAIIHILNGQYRDITFQIDQKKEPISFWFWTTFSLVIGLVAILFGLGILKK
jgi:hypothetical protein